jgi:CBS domain containing-hemolysin-like protein
MAECKVMVTLYDVLEAIVGEIPLLSLKTETNEIVQRAEAPTSLTVCLPN